MTAVIEARDLFRVHSTPEGEAAALQGLTLTVEEGEILTLFGPSGAGKTSFLRLLAGLDEPSAGSLVVLGHNLRALGRRARDRYRASAVGYLDQHYARALTPELTARELAGLKLRAEGLERGLREGRTDELLARVGLQGRLQARPRQLSGGEQQRVALCAALAHRPRLLLADEPTGELDAENAEAVYGAIADLAAAEGCTVVIVSHDPGATVIADRVVHIRDGRVSAETLRGGAGSSIVVGRGGWLRLPQEYLDRAGISSRASAALEGDRIVVVAAGEARRPDEPERGPVPEQAGEEVASVRQLGKTLGSGASATRVFSGLDARFTSGRLTVVTGRSGSGKTTLLHLLAGLELPDAGAVEVCETDMGRLNRVARAELRREHIALVPQRPGLLPFLSARENVDLTAQITRNGSGPDTLASVGLAERAGHRVSRLSAGEQVRVAVARALAARPRLLLVDEPTARLDEANARRLAALLSNLARESASAVVCATHDPVVIEQADDELALAR
jgi:ABC-type lipoprotein export system ATPase subunit